MKKRIAIIAVLVFVISHVVCGQTSNPQWNGHGYVDLGLPSGTLWADCNVGASKPTDYGDYYAWGELSTKVEFTPENHLYPERLKDDYSNQLIYDIGGNKKYDVVAATWGRGWRIPDNENWVELLEYCEWIPIKEAGGFNGYKVIGPNKKFIMLPAAGEYSNESRMYGYGRNYLFAYRTSKTGEGPNIFQGNLDGKETIQDYWTFGYEGYPIRPVIK